MTTQAKIPRPTVKEIWAYLRWCLAEWICPELADQAALGRRALKAIAPFIVTLPAGEDIRPGTLCVRGEDGKAHACRAPGSQQ